MWEAGGRGCPAPHLPAAHRSTLPRHPPPFQHLHHHSTLRPQHMFRLVCTSPPPPSPLPLPLVPHPPLSRPPGRHLVSNSLSATPAPTFPHRHALAPPKAPLPSPQPPSFRHPPKLRPVPRPPRPPPRPRPAARARLNRPWHHCATSPSHLTTAAGSLPAAARATGGSCFVASHHDAHNSSCYPALAPHMPFFPSVTLPISLLFNAVGMTLTSMHSLRSVRCWLEEGCTQNMNQHEQNMVCRGGSRGRCC